MNKTVFVLGGTGFIGHETGYALPLALLLALIVCVLVASAIGAFAQIPRFKKAFRLLKEPQHGIISEIS